jgi:hypothetical protein
MMLHVSALADSLMWRAPHPACTETMSMIGAQPLSNYALQPMSEAALIDLATADQPDAPSYSLTTPC